MNEIYRVGRLLDYYEKIVLKMFIVIRIFVDALNVVKALHFCYKVKQSLGTPLGKHLH